ncbi:MAG TPA: DUF4396 domain-containing protein [Acidobacteriaceae bacterium]|nr:DUF4396 domain-containing protein [Acidobacteriaceae bacterium]
MPEVSRSTRSCILSACGSWAWCGIGFQYFTIAPTRGLTFGRGLGDAAKADTLSMAIFEASMFGWMASACFVLFPAPYLDPHSAVFWFMIQIVMIADFFTGIPANAWLIQKRRKKRCPQ